MTSNKFERVQRLNMLKSIGFEDGALYGWTFDISLFYHEIRACQNIIRKCFPLPPRQLGYLSTEPPRRQHFQFLRTRCRSVKKLRLFLYNIIRCKSRFLY